MVRIAIVGCGRILNAHLQGYKALREAGIDDFRITALVARQADDARMFLRRGEGPPPRPPVLPPASGDPLAAPHTYLSDFQDDVEVQIFTDYQQMLDQAGVDAVNDFTPLWLHHQVGTAALKRGKHLLTQKPLAISIAAGRQLVDLAKQRGLSLGTFENVRQSRFTRAAGWAVQLCFFGHPLLALVGALGGLWSPDKVVANTPWRHTKLQGGGGGAIDIGVHQFHLLRYVFGEVAWLSAVTRTFEPVRYRRDEVGQVIETVQVEVDDTYLAVAGFENEAVAQLLWSWAGPGEAINIPDAPAFFGSQGAIKGGQLISQTGKSEPLLAYFEAKLSADERAEFFPLGLTDPYAIQQLDWLRAIDQGRDPETSGREGLHDLACAFALLESATLARPVSLAEVLSGTVATYQAEINTHYGL